MITEVPEKAKRSKDFEWVALPKNDRDWSKRTIVQKQ